MNEIIRVQTRIIGHGIAVHLARGVKELVIDEEGSVVSYEGDSIVVMSKLVDRYRQMERDVAINLARKAIKPFLEENPQLRVPDELK